MNIGNITSDNFNLDSNGKDIQIEVYEQLIEQLQQESKILKENAEHNDKVVDKVNWENMLLNKENQQLKKQVDEYKKLGFKYLQDKNNNLETQQKEFIKWLENGIEKVKNTEFLNERIQRAGLIAYNRCLQKYKSIIGDDK